MDDILDRVAKITGSPFKTPKAPKYDDLFEKHGAAEGVDPALLRAMTQQESTFNPRARSPKNAQGLMQLIPATAQRFGVTDPYDPDQNVKGGAKYMRFLLDRYNGDVDKALAGYNAGEGAVDKYKGVPPYRETRDYVKKIRGNYKGSGYLQQFRGNDDDLFSRMDKIIGTPRQPEAPDAVLSDVDRILGTQATPNPAQVEQAIAPIAEAVDTPAGRVLAATTIQKAAQDAQDWLAGGQEVAQQPVIEQPPPATPPVAQQATHQAAPPSTEQLAELQKKFPDKSNKATAVSHGAEGVLTDPGIPDEDVPPEQTQPSLGTVKVDPKWSDEEKVRFAANQVLPEHGVTPQEIDDWIKEAKSTGDPDALVKGDRGLDTFSVFPSMLEQIQEARKQTRTEEIAQTGTPQDEFDPEGTTWQKIKGLSPEEIKQENLESDPLYVEAKRNAPDDVEAEYLRLQSNEKLKAQEGESNIANYGMGDLAEDLTGKALSGAAGTADFGAGILHAINSIPHATLIGDPNSESFTQWAEKKLRSQGKQLAAPAAKYDKEHPDPSIVRALLQMGASATSDVPRIMALPGGAAVQFGGDALLRETGKQGHVSAQTLKSAGSQAVTGLLFHGAGVLGQNAKAGLLRSVLPSRTVEALSQGTVSLGRKAEAALHAYGRGVSLGTITSATAAQHLVEGGTPEDAFKSALHMALFDLAFNAKSDISELSGKVIKATDGNTTKTVTITPKGKIFELKNPPSKPDAEIDVRELINNEVSKPSPSVEPEKVLPTAEAKTETRVTSKEADNIEKQVASKIPHPNPAIDGKEIIAETESGKKIVANENNKSGISVVTDRAEPSKDFDIVASETKGIGVTRLKELRDVARRDAETDTLTGLANRAALDKALPSAEKDADTSVIAFDANNFGRINKEVGQAEGDKALVDIGNAIKQAAEENGVTRTFRRGGDEFVVLAPKEIADKIRARAEEIYGDKKYGETNVSLTGTVGRTFAAADSALQSAKTTRKTNAPISQSEGTDVGRTTGNDKGTGPRSVEGVDRESKSTTGETGKGGEPPSVSIEALRPKGKPSRVGLDIEAKTVADDLTKSFEGTAEFSPVSVKEQAEKAVKLISTDLEKARRIIAGHEPVPSDMRAAPIIDAAERYARKTGDVELLKDLANSPLVAETSRHAQELRLLAERHPNSPVKLIREVQQVREARASRRGQKPARVKQEVMDAIKGEMNRVPRRPRDWASFVDSLKC